MKRRIPIKYHGITKNGSVCTGDLFYRSNGEPCIRFWTENGYAVRKIIPYTLEMVAVKPKIFSDGDYNRGLVYHMYECPSCGGIEMIENMRSYCQHCGQRLAWSDFEEEEDD